MSTPGDDAGDDAGNHAQHEAWNGPTGTIWTTWADRFDAGVAAHHTAFLDAAEIAPAEAVLDVGCGAGRTSLDAARAAVDGPVTGVDIAAGLLAVARRRAVEAGVRNVAFREADAQVHPFPPAELDVVVSRHGSMFFADPVAAFTNLAAGLRRGGRVVLLTWRGIEHQEWMRSFLSVAGVRNSPPTDAPGPLSLSEPARIHRVLRAAGLADVSVTAHRAPMYYGADVDDAFGFVADLQSGLLGDLRPETRDRILTALRADVAAHEGADGVTYDSATWIVRARRP
ncbi:class I SAM-dependent methyltransferase [Actinomycetospora rhizophila]|uniref:Class I SAM-dependent methyltransferase n=1 Tax=Actinomycetospora rhizophila TaxID=1416876 RepID=A0ABV9Z8Q0_9PSEU